MRMRRKKNLDTRLASLSHLGAANAGQISDAARGRGIYLEVGCGKGGFICEMAARNPDRFFVAAEKYQNVILTAMERAAARGLENVRFLDIDAAALADYFADGAVSGIFLNFSDPWPAKRHAKRRLTHRNMLAVFSRLLAPGGEIRLKTDDRALFEFSLCELSQCGFEFAEVSLDLHSSGAENVLTEYEAKFSALGKSIFALTARSR